MVHLNHSVKSGVKHNFNIESKNGETVCMLAWVISEVLGRDVIYLYL